MRKPIAILFFAVILGVTPAIGGHKLTAEDRKVLDNATDVLDTLTSAPDDAIPEELLERSECVMVFPNVTKGAFIVGGRYGRGAALCRDESGAFGAPSFFSMGGASIGWQWGGQQTDFVLLIMNKDGMKNLLEDRFSLGGNASAAAGPVGRTAEAATDLQLQAQILTWSRSQGLFVGASLEGAVIQQSEDANSRLYGREVSAASILTGEVSRVPEAATEFVSVTRRVASRPSEDASAR